MSQQLLELKDKIQRFNGGHRLRGGGLQPLADGAGGQVLQAQLPVVRRALGRLLRRGLLLFQLAQQRPGPGDDDLRQARQLGDLDTVGLICRAGDDLPQEDDIALAFFHGDVIVFDIGQLPLDGGQLMVMGGK